MQCKASPWKLLEAHRARRAGSPASSSGRKSEGFEVWPRTAGEGRECTTLPHSKKPHLIEDRTEVQGTLSPRLQSQAWPLQLPDSFLNLDFSKGVLSPRGMWTFTGCLCSFR